jgi:ADP-heptose:LPS heptosyltransferase
MFAAAWSPSGVNTTSLLENRDHWVVFFANGYGDTVMVRPALHGFVRQLRGFKTLVCQDGSHLFLTKDLGFDRVVPVPMWRGEGGRNFDWEAVASAVGPCDAFLGLVPWQSPSLDNLRRALKPKTSMGHFSEYDVHVPLDHRVNNIELSFQFVRALNPMASLLDHWTAPPFSVSVQDFVSDLLGVFPPGATIVALHADTMSDKMWSDQGWRELLERFLSERPDHFVFVVGHQVPNVLPSAHSDRVIPLEGLHLEASMCVVANSHLFVGIDSCMLHVADACHIPGLGIFKSTDPSEFGFYRSPHLHVVCRDSSLSSEVSQFAKALAIVDRIATSGRAIGHEKCKRRLSTMAAERAIRK